MQFRYAVRIAPAVLQIRYAVRIVPAVLQFRNAVRIAPAVKNDGRTPLGIELMLVSRVDAGCSTGLRRALACSQLAIAFECVSGMGSNLGKISFFTSK